MGANPLIVSGGHMAANPLTVSGGHMAANPLLDPKLGSSTIIKTKIMC